MNDWVAIAIVFVAGMVSAILLLGAVTVWRIVWPTVTGGPGPGAKLLRDKETGRYYGWVWDWNDAPPWAAVLLQWSPGVRGWADGHCTGARVRLIETGRDDTLTRPEHWRVVEWRPETQQGDQ